MKKTTLKNKLLAIALVFALASSLTACGSSGLAAGSDSRTASESTSAGTILLSVNPEIEVEYDDAGIVVEIEGLNDDGRGVVTGYDGYKGRECAAVVEELVQKIYEAGYFETQVDGHVKNIVVKLENGSACPDDEFLEKVAEGVRKAVSSCGIGSAAMVVDEDDLDDQGRIGTEKARELALAQLGLKDASFSQGEYELEDGVYELEFTANGIEYEYEVDALTGKVLEADYEHNDDWNAWELDDADDDRDDIDDKDDLDDADDDRDDVDDKDDLDDADDDRDDVDDKDDLDDANDDRDDVDDKDDLDDADDDRDDVDDKDDLDDADDDRDDVDDKDDLDDANDDRDDIDDKDDLDDADDDRDDVDDKDDDSND